MSSQRDPPTMVGRGEVVLVDPSSSDPGVDLTLEIFTTSPSTYTLFMVPFE